MNRPYQNNQGVSGIQNRAPPQVPVAVRVGEVSTNRLASAPSAENIKEQKLEQLQRMSHPEIQYQEKGYVTPHMTVNEAPYFRSQAQ